MVKLIHLTEKKTTKNSKFTTLHNQYLHFILYSFALHLFLLTG